MTHPMMPADPTPGPVPPTPAPNPNVQPLPTGRGAQHATLAVVVEGRHWAEADPTLKAAEDLLLAAGYTKAHAGKQRASNAADPDTLGYRLEVTLPDPIGGPTYEIIAHTIQLLTDGWPGPAALVSIEAAKA